MKEYDIKCPIKHTCLIFESVKVIELAENITDTHYYNSQYNVLTGYCKNCNKILNKIGSFIKGDQIK